MTRIFSRPWGVSIKLATAAILVALILSRLDWSRAGEVVRSMQWEWLAAAFSIFLTMTLLEATRLNVIFGYLKLGLWGAYKLQAIGFFWASFLPGQIGGDFYRLMVVRSVGGTISQTVAALLALRVVAFFVVFSSALLGAWVVWPQMDLWADSFSEPNSASPPGGASLWLLLAAAMVAASIVATLIARYAAAPRAVRSFEMLRLAVSRLSAPRLATLLVISIGVHALRVLLMSVLARSLGIVLALDLVLFVTSAAVFANHLPISFAGLGTREAAIVVLLLPLGVAYEEGTLIAVAGRCISILFALWGGALFLMVRAGTRPVQTETAGSLTPD